jgi:hypothetical protein
MRSTIIYTSSGILSVWYKLITRKIFYGDLMSPDTIRHTVICMWRALFFYFIKFWFSQNIFLKPPTQITCGQTDRQREQHDEINTRFLLVYERPYKLPCAERWQTSELNNIQFCSTHCLSLTANSLPLLTDHHGGSSEAVHTFTTKFQHLLCR